MTLYFSTTLRNLRGEAIRTAVGSGGKIKLYTGTLTSANQAATTLLGTLVKSGAFGSATTGGVTTITGIGAETSAPNTGTAGWAKLTTSGDVWVADMTVTATGNGGELTMDSISIEAGGTITPGTITITESNA